MEHIACETKEIIRVVYVVEIRGNRSVAYIIEDGLKTCSTQVLEGARRESASSPRRYLSPFLSFAHFYLREENARTHVHAGERPRPPAYALRARRQENASVLVHVSRQTRHNGYSGAPRNTPGFKTSREGIQVYTSSSAASNFRGSRDIGQLSNLKQR